MRLLGQPRNFRVRHKLVLDAVAAGGAALLERMVAQQFYPDGEARLVSLYRPQTFKHSKGRRPEPEPEPEPCTRTRLTMMSSCGLM